MGRRRFFRNSFLISRIALSSGVVKAGRFFPASPQLVEKYLAFIGARILDDGGDDTLNCIAEDHSESLRSLGYSQKGKPYGLDRQGTIVVFR